MYISQAQSALVDMPSMVEKRYMEMNGDQVAAARRKRSYSLNVYEQSQAKDLVERTRHTFEFKENEHKGFDSYKGNIRSEYIQDFFCLSKTSSRNYRSLTALTLKSVRTAPFVVPKKR